MGVLPLDDAGSDDGADELVPVGFLPATCGENTADVHRHYHPQKNEDALKRYEAQTYRCYDVLEEQLKKTGATSILGARVTAVDYHFEPWVRQYSFAGLSLDRYPLITKWLGIMETREEVREAYYKIKGSK